MLRRGPNWPLGTAWQDSDPVGGLAALFWTPGRQLVDEVVAQAIDGDFKAAGAAGVKAITVGVAAGVALGELGTAGVEAGAAMRPKSAASGARMAAKQWIQISTLLAEHAIDPKGARTWARSGCRLISVKVQAS
jgi:hypothetical protein